MIKHLTLAAVLCAAFLPALGYCTSARAQPAGAGGDYFGGGPLTPYPRAGEAPAGASPLLTPLPYPPLTGTEQRIQELEQQNRLLSQEWTQKILRDALRR